MRNLILDHAPQLTIADPLAVRRAGFEERFGWILIHYAEALAHAETFQADVSDIANYMERYTTTENGELWIDGDKLPGVSAGNVTSVEARAVDLCWAINLAHIRAQLQPVQPLNPQADCSSTHAHQEFRSVPREQNPFPASLMPARLTFTVPAVSVESRSDFYQLPT
ncbi:hypothetical protein [Paraburkholderia phenoliruptrix]|uniref:hypothetical protein n=1 Tax=Paraburkholderia phenoliruptrix TaxID=252970 RepID=UPI001C6F0C95|nr:hypothetical protein [Paraburkholderia phenoliruptrix]MBW9106102.1 hypothetical protein [Paraburkholderia phenoliruptrix]MBW9130964.1 hypothetical protein [Paraburkholderia ginsengiterrae]